MNIVEKRGSVESGIEHQHGPRKRVKMRDLESVCRSDGISFFLASESFHLSIRFKKLVKRPSFLAAN